MKLKSKKLAGLALLLLLIPVACFGQTTVNIPSFIRTPGDLSKWFSTEFTYQTEFPDYWQESAETLNSKTGDCEDFAILAKDALSRLNISSQILLIRFQGLSEVHAICIFKDGSGYSFISNQKLERTHAASAVEAVQEKYPDWEQIILTNQEKEFLQVITRGNNTIAAQDNIISASLR